MVILKKIWGRICYMTVAKHSRVFRVCSDLYRVRGKGKALPERETTGPDESVLAISDLAEMVGAGPGTRVYGKAVLEGYEEDPGRTILMATHELALTGAPVALLSFAEILRKKGWQVVVVSPKDGELGRSAEEKGIPVLVVPDLFGSDFIRRTETLFSVAVVNTHVCAPIICDLNGRDIPVIWWIHEAGDTYTVDTARNMPQTLDENIRVYCVGEYAERMLRERMPRYDVRGHLWFYAKDTAESFGGFEALADRKSGGHRKVYALVGSIQPRKGQDVLLKAIGRLPEEVREGSTFLFVGFSANRMMKARILSACKKDPDGVMYFGGLEQKKMFELLETVDYLICASRDEPGPLIVGEAMAMGKPCICSRNAGVAKVIEDRSAGLTYDRNDPRLLSERIEASFHMPDEEYRRLSANARAAYEACFSEEVFRRNVDAIMESR